MLNNLRKMLIKLLVGSMPVCMNYKLTLLSGAEGLVRFNPDDNVIFDKNNINIAGSDKRYQMEPLRSKKAHTV